MVFSVAKVRGSSILTAEDVEAKAEMGESVANPIGMRIRPGEFILITEYEQHDSSGAERVVEVRGLVDEILIGCELAGVWVPTQRPDRGRLARGLLEVVKLQVSLHQNSRGPSGTGRFIVAAQRFLRSISILQKELT